MHAAACQFFVGESTSRPCDSVVIRSMRFWNLRFGFATIVAVMLSSAAAGEEMRAGATSAVPYQWSHYYIGAYGGYGWGDPSVGWSGNSAAEAVYLSSGGLARSTTFNPRGFLGGLHAG